MRTQNVLEDVLWAQVKVEELHFMIVRRCERVEANLKEIKDKMATVVSWESRKPESDRTLQAARAAMETTTWMLEEVQKQVNQERWDGASWCRRQTTRQLEKSARVLEKLFMEEEGSDKLGEEWMNRRKAEASFKKKSLWLWMPLFFPDHEFSLE